MTEPNFWHNLFLTAFRQPLKNYLIKTIFFQRHNKLFAWGEIEDSIWMWAKNHLTQVSRPTDPLQLTLCEQPLRDQTSYIFTKMLSCKILRNLLSWLSYS